MTNNPAPAGCRRRKQHGNASVWMLVILAAAGAFVWSTSLAMPATVASHFDAAGHANGFMPRQVYRGIMLAMILIAPGLMSWLPARSLRSPGARINLPHRDYWLAPERREQTIAFLQAQMRLFAMLLAAFLAYGHWLVVQANKVVPPRLPAGGFEFGLGVFLAASLVLVVAILRHFSRRPG